MPTVIDGAALRVLCFCAAIIVLINRARNDDSNGGIDSSDSGGHSHSPHHPAHSMTLKTDHIFRSSGPLRAISVVLERSRRALSIRRIMSLIR